MFYMNMDLSAVSQ